MRWVPVSKFAISIGLFGWPLSRNDAEESSRKAREGSKVKAKDIFLGRADSSLWCIVFGVRISGSLCVLRGLGVKIFRLNCIVPSLGSQPRKSSKFQAPTSRE